MLRHCRILPALVADHSATLTHAAIVKLCPRIPCFFMLAFVSTRTCQGQCAHTPSSPSISSTSHLLSYFSFPFPCGGTYADAGGAIDVPGNVFPETVDGVDGTAEWNIFWDPPAAKRVSATPRTGDVIVSSAAAVATALSGRPVRWCVDAFKMCVHAYAHKQGGSFASVGIIGCAVVGAHSKGIEETSPDPSSPSCMWQRPFCWVCPLPTPFLITHDAATMPHFNPSIARP